MLFEHLRHYSSLALLSLFCSGMPGIMFIVAGVLAIRKRKVITVARDISRLHWTRPTAIEWKKAVQVGKRDIAVGAFLLMLCVVVWVGIGIGF